MTFAIPYINNALTLLDCCFNVVGYLPKHQFPTLHAFSVKWRSHYGFGQLITGLALAALAYFVHCAFPALANPSYLSFPLQAVSLGLLYANHGAFNIIRSFVERGNIPGLTLVYDFYGKKVLPSLSPRYDILNLFFKSVRNEMDRVCFVTLFPLQFART